MTVPLKAGNVFLQIVTILPVFFSQYEKIIQSRMLKVFPDRVPPCCTTILVLLSSRCLNTLFVLILLIAIYDIDLKKFVAIFARDLLPFHISPRFALCF